MEVIASMSGIMCSFCFTRTWDQEEACNRTRAKLRMRSQRITVRTAVHNLGTDVHRHCVTGDDHSQAPNSTKLTPKLHTNLIRSNVKCSEICCEPALWRWLRGTTLIGACTTNHKKAGTHSHIVQSTHSKPPYTSGCTSSSARQILQPARGTLQAEIRPTPSLRA